MDRKRIPTSVKESIIKARSEGQTLREVAKLHGVCCNSVTRIYTRHCIERKWGRGGGRIRGRRQKTTTSEEEDESEEDEEEEEEMDRPSKGKTTASGGGDQKKKEPKSVAVFPDELDDEPQWELTGGVKTRSGRITRVAMPPCEILEKRSPLTSEQQIYADLNEWKRRSGAFDECTRIRCDPLRQFTPFYRKSCARCSSIRALLRRKLILAWQPHRLRNALLNYVYFHAIRIFDSNAAARYAVANSKHPYFRGYTQIRRTLHRIMADMAASLNFSPDLQIAACRPFMSFKEIKSMQDLTDMGLSAECKICQRKCEFVWKFRIFTFSGSRYRSNFEVVRLDDGTEPEPDHIALCPLHARLFIVFYHLTHMDWNCHWNCHLRLSQSLLRMPPNSSADQIIDAVDPAVFLKLAQFYAALFHQLDYNRIDTSNDIYSLCKPDTSGFLVWERVKDQLKDDALFRLINLGKLEELRNRKEEKKW